MHTRGIFRLVDDPHWQRLTSFSLILFFILLSDALLSYWVPNFLQRVLGSAFLMGLTMSFSSLIGLGADVVFPELLNGTRVRSLQFKAILTSLIFIFLLAFALRIPFIFIILMAMAAWGIYYEFLGFASQQFMSDTLPVKMHSAGWAIFDTFKNLAYFIGPLIATAIILRGEWVLLGLAMLFVLIGFLFLSLVGKHHERSLTIEPSQINVWKEFSHWKSLFVRVWPVIFLSLFMGLIDAAFWTTGAVWTANLSEKSFIGSLILPAYQLPTLFMGFVIARLKIYEHKKKIAAASLLVSGLFLALLYLNLSVFLYVAIVFFSSIALSFTFPLTEAIYTDLVARMGIERKHLVGLSSSTMSLAYIISPTVAGFFAESIGEKDTLAFIGLGSAVIALVLFLTTPRKLHLPQADMSNWH